MGGRDSGNRSRFGAKSTTEDYRTLDVRRWAREGGRITAHLSPLIQLIQVQYSAGRHFEVIFK